MLARDLKIFRRNIPPQTKVSCAGPGYSAFCAGNAFAFDELSGIATFEGHLLAFARMVQIQNEPVTSPTRRGILIRSRTLSIHILILLVSFCVCVNVYYREVLRTGSFMCESHPHLKC